MENNDLKQEEAWVAVTVRAASRYLESLSRSLVEMGSNGIWQQENQFTVYFPDALWNQRLYEQLLILLRRTIEPFRSSDLEIKRVQPENWNESWKQNFKPLRMGTHLLILPDWETPPQDEATVAITIAPKMAFGTGHHETTRLLLEMMEQELRPEWTVLDAGTGSGILAIYAANRGCKHVTAFDMDKWAIENGRENSRLNQCEDCINFIHGELNLVEPIPFDLIVANINRNVLIGLAPKWHIYSRPGGLLMLSGILGEDVSLITKTYNDEGWRLSRQTDLNEWSALLLHYERN